MKNIFWIFRRDLKRISGNFVAVIVILGMCIVPALYAWFNIAANMNPYEILQAFISQWQTATREPKTRASAA